MSRNAYNLSHIAHLAGHIGRIQTISAIPVIPGDSLKLNINGIIRLAPTRKEIVSECQVDIVAFYVKHRHILGDAFWTGTVRSSAKAEGNILLGVPVAADYRDPFYLGIKTCGAGVSKLLLRGYNFIYNRNFQVPSTVGNGEVMGLNFNNLTDLDFYPTNQTWASNMRKYGALAARLPHILNGANLLGTGAAGESSALTDADYGVLIQDDSPDVGLLDIRDLAAIKARYKGVQDVNWYAQFYDDVLQKVYNTKGVNTDADKRPDYLGRATQMLSGQDVNGTDDATLGSFVGKTLDRVSFNMPRRFFPEHGMVWIMAVLRYPMLHTKEQHPLLANEEPDAQLLLANPDTWGAQQPVQFNPAAWLSGGSVYTPTDTYQQPYGQEYRYQPNRVHPNFETIPGYPFTAWDTTSPTEWYYYRNNEYKDTFQTSQIGQWQAHLSVNCTKYTQLDGVDASIHAGA